MKIGIITFHFAHNYGAMLQAHALMCAIEAIGHTVQIIDYTPEKLAKEYTINPFNFYKRPKNLLKGILKVPFRIKQYSLFEHFLKKQMQLSKKVSTEQELSAIAKEFDTIIVGSDQVWNDSITGEIDTYFLNFVDNKTKKISYAASFGTINATDHIKNCVKNHLSDFHYVSVREDSGAHIISKLSNITVTQVSDPVFLMDASYWDDKTNNIKSIKQPYILYYSLQNNPKLKNFTEMAALQLGLPVYSIHPLASKQRVKSTQLYNIGPLEFVDLIKNAELVCTNSFHAVAFSVIFKRKLLHVPHSKLGSRVESLLSSLDVNIDINSNNFNELVICPSMINYKKLVEMEKQSKEYLRRGVSTTNDPY